ncbi:neural/ectodermal development factor IMP-L2-like protein [Dinothrombium tinctorium]|uniref:Neural/ectodermal development factor IMP-L2-like protein n=1 Tax=Dinothrombium tinctorium TaxID=1965070 RepID=A0A3S3RIC4_9ACAR|nr:neural/ectodermal development factor IMP-L2-like protein [Dinothrombium tinctorium]
MISMRIFLLCSLLLVEITQNIECRAASRRLFTRSPTYPTAKKPEFLWFFYKPKPQIFVQSEASKYVECVAVGNPKPMISWYRNGKPILENVDETINDRIIKTEGVRVGSRLYFDCLQPEDSGTYTCFANNSKFQANTTFDLIVEKANAFPTFNNVFSCRRKNEGISPARINLWSEVMFVLVGFDAKLNCRSSGNPNATVSWFKSNICDESAPDKLIENSDKYIIQENGDLIIKNLQLKDVNKYHCKVSNEHGTDMRTTVVYPVKPEKIHS